MRPVWVNAREWPAKGDNPFVAAAKVVTASLDMSGRLVAVFCLAVMFLALLVNVVLRYVAGSGIAWAYEIHSVLLPWLVGGGVVVASAQGRQIAITILFDALRGPAARALLVFIQIAILSIAVGVLWSSPPILNAAKFQRLSTLGITQIWGYASLIYAFAGMAVIALLDILRLLTGEEVDSPDIAKNSLS